MNNNINLLTQTSLPQIKNLAKALLKAQQEMGGAAKGASNPFFKSKYADYGSVLEAVKGPLNNAGVVILQSHRPGHEGTGYSSPAVVVTTLIHAESGESISSETPIVVAKQNDPQAFGSAITYARRYGLQSLLSLPTEDDDGEGAMARGSKKTTETKTTVPTMTKSTTPKVESTQSTQTTTQAESPKKTTFRKPTVVKETKPVEQSNGDTEVSEWEN